MSFSVQNLSSQQRAVLRQLGVPLWQRQGSDNLGVDPLFDRLQLSSGESPLGCSWWLLAAPAQTPQEQALLDDYGANLGAQQQGEINWPKEPNAVMPASTSLILMGLSGAWGNEVEDNCTGTIDNTRCLCIAPLARLLECPEEKNRAWQATWDFLQTGGS